MDEAAPLGDVFVTLTGDIRVITRRHFEAMKDGAVVANSGHFDVEIDIPALRKMSKRVIKGVRAHVDEYLISKNKSIHLLAQGRLINLSAATGHPPSVMDMSFATQALAAEWAKKLRKRLPVGVHDVPKKIEDWVSKLKLQAMGVKIDRLTRAQVAYLASSGEGT